MIYSSFSWQTFTTLCLAFSVFILLNINVTNATTVSSKISGVNESYWSIGQNMPTARTTFTAVELSGKIYAIGGEDYAAGGGQKDIVEVYDIANDKWIEDGSPMPLALDHLASAVYDGKIYVVGGFLEKKVPTDKLFIYDPKKNEWREGKSLPSPRAALTAEFINGMLYAVGGVNSSLVPVDTNYVYDPKTNTWTTKAPMPTARHHLASAVVDGKLFVIGGRILGDGVAPKHMDQTLTNLNRNEMYNPQTDSWTVRQPMLTKRSGFTAANSSDGNIYVFGGQGFREVTESVEKYDPMTDKWSHESTMPTPRYGIKAVPFSDGIYVLGGKFINDSSIVPSDLNEVFHIGKDEKG